MSLPLHLTVLSPLPLPLSLLVVVWLLLLLLLLFVPRRSVIIVRSLLRLLLHWQLLRRLGRVTVRLLLRLLLMRLLRLLRLRARTARGPYGRRIRAAPRRTAATGVHACVCVISRCIVCVGRR